ncbi:TPA: transcriptional regulator [Vibrio vulnificus]|uniref:Transcriptional regulator n=1 Tax=Vibrio vulnificus TaxID=672 RepID=A0A8H9MVK1_VIBVL|nr:helix-turn-helix transcriptional regulator [Vibrio vulnificus]HAS8538497.1 transcriptional regulator [Vibrio vulnificus]
MAKKVVPLDTPNLNQAFTAQHVGNIIKARRTQMGLTIVDLAELSQVNKNTVGKIESGNPNVGLDGVIKLFNSLGLDLRFSAFGVTTTQSKEDAENDWV